VLLFSKSYFVSILFSVSIIRVIQIKKEELFIYSCNMYPVIDPNEHINTIVEKSFITAMDTEIGGRYGR